MNCPKHFVGEIECVCLFVCLFVCVDVLFAVVGRMSAVFGGVYCLRRRVQSLVVAGDTVTGIVCSHGQKISCSYVTTSILFPDLVPLPCSQTLFPDLVLSPPLRSVITSAALVKDSLNLGESVR